MPRRKYPELELSIETVTPEIATKWLESNTLNRRVSERLVDVLAEAIVNDEWRLNGEAIIFDKNGTLQSGQHRLLAVIQADMPIMTVVVRGAEPEGLFSLDSGRKRTIADALYIKGEKDVNNLGTALSWLWRYKTDNMDRPGTTAANTHLLAILDELPAIRDSVLWGARLRRVLSFSNGMLTALHYIFSTFDTEEADDFYEKVWTGTELKAGHPCHVLREWAGRAKVNPRRPSTVMTAAVTIKAWNAYREHRDIRVLVFKANEEFPTII